MTSLIARGLRPLIRSQLKPSAVDDDFAADLRRRITGVRIPSFLGRGVGRRVVEEGELGTVRGEWVGVPAAHRHVLYVHGGYYLAGQTQTYRTLAGRLAAGLGADVLLVEYRLAPEHPFPAGRDDVFDAYRAMLDAGADPGQLAVVGDSAGGGLVLALLLRARDEGVPLPAAAVLLSPWVDLSCSSGSVDRNDEADDMLSAAALRRAARFYAGSADPSDPAVSPALADLHGLPPIFVTADESETLLDDALAVEERVRAAGGRCDLRRTTGLFHVWPVFVPVLPEARETVTEIVEFLDRELT